MYLVFDVGGTYIKYALESGEGVFTEKNKIKTPIDQGEGVPEFLDVLENVYRKLNNKADIDGIAISLPGQIDVERGIVYGGGNIKYLHEAHLGELLSKRCDGVPVALENDGKCAALAEVWLGNAKECRDACVLVFGTGIGGGIVIDRKIHRGTRLGAGEISFCFGDMERSEIANIKSLESLKTAEDAYENIPFSWGTKRSTRAITYNIAKAKGIPFEEVNGEIVYKWIAEGDQVVIDMMEDAYFDIAKYCLTLYSIIDPDIILIGGGISAQPAFVEGIKKYVEQLKKTAQIYEGIKVDVCKFRNDSNLLGAVYNFKQKYGLIK